MASDRTCRLCAPGADCSNNDTLSGWEGGGVVDILLGVSDAL